MKNVTQTVEVFASTLVKQRNFTPELRALLDNFFNNKGVVDNEEEFLAELKEKMSDELKTELASYGVEYPTEKVPLQLNLGNFFFDIITATMPQPQAPLKFAVYQKQVQDLATRLHGDELEVTTSDLTQVRTVLDDDEKWSKARVNVDILVKGGEKKILSLTPNGLSLFSEVIQASIAIFEGQKEEFEKKKQEKKLKKGK